jgi:hypothetical protein
VLEEEKINAASSQSEESTMHFRYRRILLGIIIVLITLNSAALSDELEATSDSATIENRNKIILFGGVTQDGGEVGASIGLEYEYRINPLFGIGAFGEYAGGDFDTWVFGIPGFIHPYAGWFIRLAPGLEFEGSETLYLFRTGVGYEFELSPRWGLAPEFNVDLLEGGKTEFVYGLSLSYGF